MRIFKTSVVLMLAVFFIACGSSESTNTNSSQSAPPVVSSANSNASAPTAPVAAPTAAPAGNANQSAYPAPSEKKDEKAEEKPDAKVSGAAVYGAQKCGLCHGPDGKGKVKDVPDFTDAAWQQKTSDAAMTEQIKKGMLPKMPAYEGKVSDAEIKALIRYIRSFAK